MHAQELLASAEADAKRLREEVRKEEDQNNKKAPRFPRKIEGRELGAKVELAAAEKAVSWLHLAEESVDKERPLGRGYVYKETLLDIAEGRHAPGKIDSIVMGETGTRGLHDYFEEGMELNQETLEYQKNPAIAMRAIPYLYRDRRRVRDYERVVEKTLSELKKGESVREATDVDSVYINYERLMVPKEHSDYSEERLQMSVVVDYL